MYDLLLFDLDGTLCDPLDGISRCTNYALTQHGFEGVERAVVAKFIGPPLDTVFEGILGTASADLVDQLIDTYRERYSDIGYSECFLYPGVVESLQELARRAIPLAVCTSKRADFAERILSMFGIADLFRFIDGGGVRVPKTHQIRQLRKESRVSLNSIMIGDRAADLIAAHSNGLHSAGVLWGYGGIHELEAESPRFLFRTPRQWSILLGGTEDDSPSGGAHDGVV